ncbi:MAG: hypothetical protein ACI38A_06075 [Candidatus Ornithomonoglobus sp.]
MTNELRRKIWNLIRGGGFHGYLRTASGYPLALTDCMAEYPVSLSVSCNTVQDGTPSPDNPVEVQGVGDKTNNLFYPTVFDFESSGGLKYELQADGGIHIYGTKIKDGTWLAIKSLFELSESSYTPRLLVVPNVANESTEITKNKWGVLYTTDTKTDTYVSPFDSTIKLSEGEALKSVKFYYTDPIAIGTYVDITLYLMLNEGETALPYEPYGGYKCPLLLSNSDGEQQTFPIYMDTPLYGNGDVSDSVELDVRNKTATLTQQYYQYSFNGAEKSITSGSNSNGVVYGLGIPFLRKALNSLCNKCSIVADSVASPSATLKTFSGVTGGGYDYMYFYVPTTLCANINEFKAWLSELYAAGTPLTVVYQLATPVTTDISGKIDWDSIPKLWSGTVIITADTTVSPSGITVKYYADKPEEVN